MSDAIDVRRLKEAARAAFADRGEVVCAYAFGSRIAGSALPASDLDIALVLRPEAEEADPLIAERMGARLSVVMGPGIDIDCRSAATLPLALRGRIVTDGVLVYEGDAVGRVRFETDVRRLYFDFLPLIERDAREGLMSGG